MIKFMIQLDYNLEDNMKKIITRLFIFIVLCLFAINPLNTHALMSTEDDLRFSEISSTNLMPSQDLKYKTLDYVIDEYNVNIIVNENNTFDITETMRILMFLNTELLEIFL